MDKVQVVLPGILLLACFVIKLVVDRAATLPDFVHALLELPVDAAFFATSLVAAFAIATPERVVDGVLEFVGYLGATIVVVVIWRRAQRAFDIGQVLLPWLLGLANYCLCGYGLLRAIELLASASK